MADYEAMTTDELRDRLKGRGVGGIWDMKKEELVEALAEIDGGGGHGDGSNGRDGARPGATSTTRDHEVVKQWAESRGATPATVAGTEHNDHLGVLRFDFPGYGGEDLEHVDWDEWFATFDERALTFVYQETRKDGSQSNFFRLTSGDREDA